MKLPVSKIILVSSIIVLLAIAVIAFYFTPQPKADTLYGSDEAIACEATTEDSDALSPDSQSILPSWLVSTVHAQRVDPRPIPSGYYRDDNYQIVPLPTNKSTAKPTKKPTAKPTSKKTSCPTGFYYCVGHDIYVRDGRDCPVPKDR